MNKFSFKEDDRVGEDTLDVIAGADRFNAWMYQTIKPFCSGRILEIGSGIGNISSQFLKDGAGIMVSDIREGYCRRLEENFGMYQNLLGVVLMDLTDADFEEKFKEHLDSFDTVFALNVVEHIKDDALALNNIWKLLKPGGNAVILVPSYQSLYNGFDRELEHYRRYTKKSLAGVFERSPFHVIHSQYFNFTGIFGWYLSGSILKKKSIPGGQMKLYNALIPVIRLADRVVFRQAGLSTIMVGRK